MKKELFPVFAFLLGSVCSAIAADLPEQTQSVSSFPNVSISGGIGWLHGEAGELVYGTTGEKVSQLDWKINAPIFKLDISIDAFDWLSVSARGWTALKTGNSTMDNRDWWYSNTGVSYWWSHFGDTDLNYANQYELNAKGWLLKQENYKLGVLFGYQESRFSWTASGGIYNYANGTIIGSFQEGLLGYGYKQKFMAPFIGLAGQYKYQNFEVSALLKYSAWARAEDLDQHYRRQITFIDKSSGQDFFSAELNLGYYFTPNLKVFAEGTWTLYDEVRAGATAIFHNTGVVEYYPENAAGIENKHFTITAGLQYNF